MPGNAEIPAHGSMPPARKTATIYDIAREAGVSHQSVSRFMRGIDLRLGTRQKIELALEHLEYKPNLTARSLVTGKSHRIGALTHEIDQVGPSQVLQGAGAAARDAGYLLDIVALDMGDEGEIAQALEVLLQHDLAGLVALASTDQMRAAVAKFALDIPILIFAEEEKRDGANDSDRLNGIPLVMRHLLGLGHREFAHIGGPATWSAARNRRRAFEEIVAECGLSAVGRLEGDWSASSGYVAAQVLLRDHVPTAIVAANDQMALGAILALNELGLRVPEDVSVTGVDDIPESAYFGPPLTTVRTDFKSEGRRAVNALLTQSGADVRSKTVSSPLELVVRRSTAKPRRRSISRQK